MMVSPFTYYRGAALPMASDLAATPVSGLAVQACGDAHLSNFGLFGSAERRLMFDVNDFDETLPGPWEWDVKRLAASLEVAARDNGFPAKQRREIVMAAVSRYRQAMREFAAMTNLDVWYAHADVNELRAQFDAQLRARQRKLLDKGLAKARTRDSMQELAKLTRMVDGRPRIISDPPLAGPGRRADAGRDGPGDLRSGTERPDRQVPAHAGDRSPVPAPAVRVLRHGPQGRRGRQRRNALLDRPDARPRRRPIRCSCRSRRQKRRSSAGSSAPANTPTRASGWSPASG